MNKYPLVSVIIPFVYDRGFLQQAMKSVKNQYFDGEIELILSQSDNTAGYNFNRGIERSTGDYITYLCDDDILTPNSIEDSVKAIQGHEFIHGDAINFYENGREVLQKPRIPFPSIPSMITNNVIHGGTVMYKREVFEKYGMFDESLTTGEEYDFNLMILSKGATINYCPKVLYLYRRWNGQKSLGNRSGEYQAKRKVVIDGIKMRYARFQ